MEPVDQSMRFIEFSPQRHDPAAREGGGAAVHAQNSALGNLELFGDLIDLSMKRSQQLSRLRRIGVIHHLVIFTSTTGTRATRVAGPYSGNGCAVAQLPLLYSLKIACDHALDCAIAHITSFMVRIHVRAASVTLQQQNVANKGICCEKVAKMLRSQLARTDRTAATGPRKIRNEVLADGDRRWTTLDRWIC